MPLYEYKCDKCEQVFEVIQKFSDEPLTVHEGCGGKVERQLSSPALQFKGSGWYITDYARSGSANSKGSNGKNSGSSSGSEGASSSTPSSSSTASKDATSK